MYITPAFLFVVPALSGVTALVHNAALGPISLRKRLNFTNANGTVNHNALRAHTGYEKRKLTNDPNTRNSESGAVVLTSHNNDFWSGEITAGTPPITFNVVFDTGSSILFLPGQNSGGSCGSGQAFFNPSSSSSAENLGAEIYNVTFTSGWASGQLWTDVVSVGGYTATNQTVLVAQQCSPSYAENMLDGVVGLGYPSLTAEGVLSLFSTLISQNALPQPVFSFKLSSSGSELLVGGVDTGLYSGAITYAPVTVQQNFQIVVDSVSVNGSQITKNVGAIVDTASTLVYGDGESIAALYNSIGGTPYPGLQGLYMVPCDSMPTINIEISGKSINIPPEAYNLGTDSDSNGQCISGIAENSPASVETWVLGDIFLRNTYTIFDMGENRVGFADLA